MGQILDFVLHLDQHIYTLFTEHGTLTYLIICLILFCETGLVITPFLPGDSLLFATGVAVANIRHDAIEKGVMTTDLPNIWIMIPLMILAVFTGDNVNYFMGSKIGVRLFEMKIPFLKKEYLHRTERFYEKHGGKTVVLARFIPIIRTFAPFVAGLGAMNYKKYISFCIGGGVSWVTLMTLLGYFFGGLPFVRNHFETVIIAVIFLSLLPILVEYLINRYKERKQR
jgi:membrane-associated protein